jgi:hypothetical protein
VHYNARAVFIASPRTASHHSHNRCKSPCLRASVGRRAPPPPYAASTVPVSRRPRAAVPPRARDRFERSTAIAARRLPPQLSSVAPAAAAAAVPRRRRRPRHLFPNEHLRRSTPRHSPSALERILSTTHSATGVRTTYGGHFPSRTSRPSAPRASLALYHAVARSSACRTPQTQGVPPVTCTTATTAIAHPPRRLLSFTCTTILSCPHAASL